MDTRLKSPKNKEKVYVRFVNKTAQPADVTWIDFEGAPVKYSTLKPNAYVDIDTFVGHPWMFENHITKDKLAVNNEFYFFAPSWKELRLKKFLEAPDNMSPHRIIVMITLPVYSLRERSLQIVRDHCLNMIEKPETIRELENVLPKSVLDDLIIKLFKKDGIYIA